MNLARKVAEGVGGWLQFEFHCNRSELFSEKYLSVPIGQILNSAYGQHVYAEVKHPVLAPRVTGPGRRPEVDFAVLDPYPHFKLAIEAKWVPKGGLPAEAIIWDMIRLELVAWNSKVPCYFLLAGRKPALEALFRSAAFRGQSRRMKEAPLLRADSNRLYSLHIDSPSPARASIIKRLLARHQKLSVPARILSQRSQPFPMECKSTQYQVYTWRIMSPGDRRRFKPAEHRVYSAPGMKP